MHHQASFIPSFFPEGTELGVDADFFYFPAYESKDLGKPVLGAGTLFAITNDSDAARAFIEWLETPIAHEIWMAQSGLLTAFKGVSTDAYANDALKKQGEILRNRLIARGPRFRVPAETVRDVALVASGLLDRTVGGTSVFPYQPDGVWTSTYSSDTWSTATDSSRLRRGMYTFWRRTSPYPTFLVFDATSREVTCSRRSRTNTPLQALALLNDRSFLEAAVGLARRMRMMCAAGRSVEESAALGFRLCVARAPDPGELDVLVRLFEAEREHFSGSPEAAAILASAPDDPDAVELAAWVVVANALLNLDETVTKG
jgi:hypothetical protein